MREVNEERVTPPHPASLTGYNHPLSRCVRAQIEGGRKKGKEGLTVGLRDGWEAGVVHQTLHQVH